MGVFGKSWYEGLASELGATVTDGQTAGVKVVWGELGYFDFAVFGSTTGPAIVIGVFPEGECIYQCRRRLDQDLELAASLRQAKGEFDLNRFQLEDGALQLVLPDTWSEKPPKAPALAGLMRQLSAAILAGAPAGDRFCKLCRKVEARLEYHDGPERLCPECAQLLAKQRQDLEALDAGQAGEQAEEGIEFDHQLSPKAMLAQSRDLQASLERNPAGYWRMLLGWVFLGQLAMAGGLLILLAVITGAVGLVVAAAKAHSGVAIWIALKLFLAKGAKLLVVGLGLMAALWNSVTSWFRIPKGDDLPPVRLTRDQAPRLYAWLDELGHKVGAPRVDLFVINDEVNAAATERQLGRGDYRRVVMAGVPLLEIADVEEFEAVMAHELAHLRHDDPRSLRIYRTVQSWSRVGASVGGEGGFGSFASFAQWYIPRFLVRAQVYIRHCERAADARAHQQVDPQIEARLLIKLAVVSRMFGEAIGTVMRRQIRQAESERDLVRLALREVGQASDEAVQKAYRRALEQEQTWLDTHPVLSEQLAILGIQPPERIELDLQPEHPASSLVDDYERVRARALGPVAERWEITLPVAMRASEGELLDIERLEARLANTESDTLHFRLGRLYNRHDRDELAVEHYRKALALNPAHRGALHELAGLLDYLNRGPEAADVLEEHLPEDGESVPLMMTAVEILHSQGRKAGLAECCRKLLALDPPASIREHLEQRLAT
ncbi:MAG: M48 family metalloprotease [Vulcanimicrobiota bacterium]